MAQYLLFTSRSWDKFPVCLQESKLQQQQQQQKEMIFNALRRIEASHLKVAMNHTKDICCSMKENMSKQL